MLKHEKRTDLLSNGQYIFYYHINLSQFHTLKSHYNFIRLISLVKKCSIISLCYAITECEYLQF